MTASAFASAFHISRIDVTALGLLISAAMLAPAAAEVATLAPRPNIALRVLILPAAGTPVATAVLLAGGHGRLGIGEDGRIADLGNNFVIRNRQTFAAQGLAVIVMDAPSDRPQGLGTRTDAAHTTDLGAVVAYARQRFRMPVWLVGTSRGTISAVNAAARLSGATRPDGIVLTSSITRPGGKETATVYSLPIERVSGPVLVAAHEEDICQATPPADVPQLLARLARAAPKVVRTYRGGAPARSDPCRPRSPHGFFGLDERVVGDIAAFIRNPGAMR